MSSPAESTHRRLESALAKTWPGSKPQRIVALKGDASTRRFWRVAIDAAATRTNAAALARLTSVICLGQMEFGDSSARAIATRLVA